MNLVLRRLIGFALVSLVFGVLEALFTHQRRPRGRPGRRTDFVHFLLSPALVQVGVVLVAAPLALLLWFVLPASLGERVATLPGWAQFLTALFLLDGVHYGWHRAAHRVPFLWRLHAVHHSSEHLDWLASVRIHPLDQILNRVVSFVPLFVLGFSRETFGAYLAFTPVLGLLIHSNVDLPLGPLRWIFVTPEHHHWHHSQEVRCNYAGQLPFWDWLFGTLHVPGRLPERYGCDAPVPEGWWAQMRFPFRKASPPTASGAAVAP